MIKEWLDSYQIKTEEELLDAFREIMQEIVLSGLSRTDFFKQAAFYGGTALRIFYGLDRYSEDLDFSLLQKNPVFSLNPYLPAIKKEFESLGMIIDIHEKKKKVATSVESAFLKSETIWKELVLEDIIKQTGIKTNKRIKIKIEIDTQPPLGFDTEEKLLVRPFSFYVKCFSMPDLFAGKMHALLFRKWKNRVKGRDWYDMEWYIRKGVPLSLSHFLQRAKDTGDWKKDSISQKEFMELLHQKIDAVVIEQVKEDIVRFIKDPKVLDIWSPDYFKDLVEKMKIKQ